MAQGSFCFSWFMISAKRHSSFIAVVLPFSACEQINSQLSILTVPAIRKLLSSMQKYVSAVFAPAVSPHCRDFQPMHAQYLNKKGHNCGCALGQKQRYIISSLVRTFQRISIGCRLLEGGVWDVFAVLGIFNTRLKEV